MDKCMPTKLYKRIAAILFIIIIVSSFFAYLIESSGGRIQIIDVKFDTRGAVQDADLYIPVGTSDRDSLPCIVLSHGGGCTNGVMKGVAQEIARRGIVVLNVSSYGAGLSGQPMYDEDGNGVEGMAVESQGLWDAVNYVRTLKYVDQTRIAIGGHSQGAYRSAAVAKNDCQYYTLNDLCINIMYNEFGIEFTEEQITQNADSLAQEMLDEEQLVTYNILSSEAKEWWDTRIKAVVAFGSATAAVTSMMQPQTVNVAGYEVERFVQTNICNLVGKWDHNYPFIQNGFVEGETYSNDYYQTGDTLIENTWLQLTDSGTSIQLGTISDTFPYSSEELHNAIENRSTRILLAPDKITHSGEFISNRAISDFVDYVTQVFEYNNGPLGGENSAIDADNMIWLWRELLNALAMLAMIGLIVALLALLKETKTFAVVAVAEPKISTSGFISKAHKYVYYLMTVVAAFVACYWANNKIFALYNTNKFLPQDGTAPTLYAYLFWVAVLLLVVMCVSALISKKRCGVTGFENLGIAINIKRIVKAFLLVFLLMLCGYLTLAIIEYWFNQDYRLWMCVFTELQPLHWAHMVKYFVMMVPLYFVISMSVNFGDNRERPKHPVLSLAVIIVVGSLGVYLNHIINNIVLFANDAPNMFSEFTMSGGLLIFVPISIYIARQTYRLTGSIWTGAFLNTILTAWMWTSAISCTNVYWGTTFIEKVLGI
ncbi:MAG TPA: hypothetical protein IAB47_04775 [Candidatus Scatomorpha merdigallinarum]|nr:hypothetical protein [Candidatus Scatomorpha merdigallinarum]